MKLSSKPPQPPSTVTEPVCPNMVRYKTPVHAPPPKYMQHETYIEPPSLRTYWVGGTAKYNLIDAQIGPRKDLKPDDKVEQNPVRPRVKTPRIKRELSHAPSRAPSRGQPQGSLARLKRESPANILGGQSSPQVLSSPVGADRSGPPHSSMQSYGDSNSSPLEDSSTYTFTSSPDSASSSLGFEFDDSSSSSEDDIDSDVYTPSTSPSKISSTSPRTRQQTAREATTKPRAKQPLREQTMSEKLEGSEYAPLDFYIDLPARPVHSETGKGDPSIPQSSPQGVLSHQVSSNGTHH